MKQFAVAALLKPAVCSSGNKDKVSVLLDNAGAQIIPAVGEGLAYFPDDSAVSPD